MEDTIFGKIIARKIPAKIAYEDEQYIAIHDVNPQAPVHLLVLPERHIDSFREIGEFPAEEAKRMLEFVADVAAREGLTDYRVAVNVGPSAGQTVFHLHWHIKGGWV